MPRIRRSVPALLPVAAGAHPGRGDDAGGPSGPAPTPEPTQQVHEPLPG